MGESKAPTYCSICGRKINGVNGIVCLFCLNAESIIIDGLTLLDKGLNKSSDPAATAFEKVRLLIQEGWHVGN